MQFPLAKIFIKKRSGGFQDEDAKLGKLTTNQGGLSKSWEQGLFPGGTVAAGWQASGVRDLARTVENLSGMRTEPFAALSFSRWGDAE